jgi:hypothetical protein
LIKNKPTDFQVIHKKSNKLEDRDKMERVILSLLMEFTKEQNRTK